MDHIHVSLTQDSHKIKMRFIILAKIELEIEAVDKQAAQDLAGQKFDAFSKEGAKISEAKVVHKDTGYFV